MRRLLFLLLLIPFAVNAFPLGITIKWDASTGATSYTPAYKLVLGGWVGRSTTGLVSLSTVNVNVGDNIQARVKACNADGCSGYATVTYKVQASDQPPPIGVPSVPAMLNIFVTPASNTGGGTRPPTGGEGSGGQSGSGSEGGRTPRTGGG